MKKQNPLESNQAYQDYVDQKTPNSPILKNCFYAFLVGGFICSLGQIIFEYAQSRGVDETTCYTIVSVSLIFLSSFLTALNVFNRIGKLAGAGSLIPITGFANSIVSPAMEWPATVSHFNGSVTLSADRRDVRYFPVCGFLIQIMTHIWNSPSSSLSCSPRIQVFPVTFLSMVKTSQISLIIRILQYISGLTVESLANGI